MRATVIDRRALTPAAACAARLCACGLAVVIAAIAGGGPATAQVPAPAAAPVQPPAPKTKTAIAKPAAKSGEAQPAAGASNSSSGQAIVVLVNDEPITGYEITQRQRMLGLSANIQNQAAENFKRILQQPGTNERLKAILNDVINANRGKTKEEVIAIFEARKKQFAQSLQKQAVEGARASVLPGLRKSAIEELIDERLKTQEAKRLNVLASEEEADRMLKGIAERNKMTDAQFAEHIKGLGADVSTMKSRFRAGLSWQQVIRRRFGHQIAITERDVDRVVAAGAVGSNDETVELQVQRITLAVPAKLDQKAIAQRFQDAETLRRKFGGCKTAQALAATATNASFEDLGARKSASLPEPTRTLLLNAKDGEMLPPSVGAGGVELWAVCGRSALKPDLEKRSAAQEELRQKELDVLAKRHLKDLRQDATIEYR